MLAVAPAGVRFQIGGWLVLAVLTTGCAERLREPKPTPPDLAALQAAYAAAPTAPLDAETIETLLDQAGDLQVELTEYLNSFDFVRDSVLGPALDSLLEGQAQALTLGRSGNPPELAVRRQTLELESTGFVRIRHICHGWDAGATEPDEERNGRIELTAGFTDLTIDQTVWGEFLACRLPVADQTRLFLDSQLELRFAEALPLAELDRLAHLPFVTRLAGTLGLDDAPPGKLTVDFQWLPDLERIKVRLPVGEEHLFFFLDPILRGFQAADGEWCCDLTQRRCTNAATGQVLP